MSIIRSGDLPLLASGRANLSLVIVHHKQQCRPTINRKGNYMYICNYYLIMSLTTSTCQTIYLTEKLVIAGKNNTLMACPLKWMLFLIQASYLCMQYTYLNFIPFSSWICSLYMSRPVCRFAMLSPALKSETRTVFLIEFGWTTSHRWRLNLKLLWPLSPPNLTQSSLEGIALLCQVRPWGELCVLYCVHTCVCISFRLHLLWLQIVSETLAMKLVQ